MMADVRSINALRADRANDNRLLSPLEALEDAAADIRSGKRAPDKLLVLMLTTGEHGEGYQVNFNASNLKNSEMIALLEVFKERLLHEIRGQD